MTSKGRNAGTSQDRRSAGTNQGRNAGKRTGRNAGPSQDTSAVKFKIEQQCTVIKQKLCKPVQQSGFDLSLQCVVHLAHSFRTYPYFDIVYLPTIIVKFSQSPFTSFQQLHGNLFQITRTSDKVTIQYTLMCTTLDTSNYMYSL